MILHKNSSKFTRFSQQCSRITGMPATFGIAGLAILIWGISGPYFNFSDTWQLVINTSTTIITFLMVFLIQNTQNRDSAAVQLKLDELIRANENARNDLLDLEKMEEKDLLLLRNTYEELAEMARIELEKFNKN